MNKLEKNFAQVGYDLRTTLTRESACQFQFYCSGVCVCLCLCLRLCLCLCVCVCERERERERERECMYTHTYIGRVKCESVTFKIMYVDTYIQSQKRPNTVSKET
jgi:hypothetical protein